MIPKQEILISVAKINPIHACLFVIESNMPESILESIFSYKIKKKKLILTVHANEENIKDLFSVKSIDYMRLLLHDKSGEVLSIISFKNILPPFLEFSNSYEDENLVRIKMFFNFDEMVFKNK